MTPHRQAGQTLLVAIMVICLLMMVIVPTVLYFSRNTTRIMVTTHHREKAETAIQEASAYVSRVFSSTTTWAAAQSGVCPEEFSKPDSPSAFLKSASGTPYTIVCDATFNPNPGQVRLQITAYGIGKENTPLRTAILTLGQRTLARGPTAVQAPIEQAAVLLLSTPTVAGDFQVHWGPLLCYDSIDWELRPPFSRLKYPRKFSAGAFAGEGVSNEKRPDLFPKMPMGFVPVINEQFYKNLAERSKGVRPPVASDDLMKTLYSDPRNSGYFYLDQVTAAFLSMGFVYQAPTPTTVLFIDGNATLENVFLKLNEGGALIVKGNLLLTAKSTKGDNPVRLPLPTAADREYPDENDKDLFLCGKESGYYCNDKVPIDIFGFVYVKGDLILESAGSMTDSQWAIAGALRVDGRLIIPKNTGLTVYYNEDIGNNIRVSGSSIEIISLETK